MTPPPLVLPRSVQSALIGVRERFDRRLPPPEHAARVERKDAEDVLRLGLRDFVREAWPILEPANPLKSLWHVDCLCDHLEAVSNGQLRKLLVNIPPRATKSRTVSCFWPAWDWSLRAWRRWLFNSYAQSLALRDALATRRLIESGWYQQRWGEVYQLTDDQNRKERYDTTLTGFRVSTSVDGSNTGEGGDISVADDPHNVKEGESEADRVNVVKWWDETMGTRYVDPNTFAQVIVMQRVHDADLSGHVLREGGYHHLCLPGEWEPPVYVPGTDLRDKTKPQPHDDCPIHPDPRTSKGEVLDPDRFSPGVLAELKARLKPYGYAGQVQQRPVPRSGALFADDQIRRLPPDFDYPGPDGRSLRQKLLKVCFFDLHYSEAEMHDATAGVTVGIDRAMNVYVLNVWTNDDSPASALPEQAAYAIRALQPPTRPQVIGVEQAAFKKVPTQNFVRMLRQLLRVMGVPLPVMPPRAPKGDKVGRAMLVSDVAKVGQLFADKDAPWYQDWITELTSFPKANEDDRVDATSGAVQLALELMAVQETGGQGDPGGTRLLIEEGARRDEPDDWLDEVFDGRRRLPGGGLGRG